MTQAPYRLDLPADPKQLKQLKIGDEVRLFGTLYTLRDMGHKRVLDYLKEHGVLPFGLAGQALFYAGPTPPPTTATGAATNALATAVLTSITRPFGAIGPTTASRMDFATPELLAAGINVMLGKGDRSLPVVESCKATNSVYLVATGGAAAFLANSVKSAEVIAFEDLGTEALHKLTVEQLPAFVAIDKKGRNLYTECAHE